MKIFISWSGERSRIIAEGLNSWLPKVIQAVKPFYSPEIEKGTRGIEEINKNLEETSFGIICLTPDNLKSEWIHYETGALSKKIEGARIWTFLHGLKPSDVAQPFAQFQHTLAKKEDIYKLLDSINAKSSEPLEKSFLKDSFERCWSDFEEVLERAEKTADKEDNGDSKDIRSNREVLDEILELLRNERRNSNPDFELWLQDKSEIEQRISVLTGVILRPVYNENTLELTEEGIKSLTKKVFPTSTITRLEPYADHIYKLTLDRLPMYFFNKRLPFLERFGLNVEIIHYEFSK